MTGETKRSEKKDDELVRVLINKSRLDTPSWFDTPFSILSSEDVLCPQHQAWALRWSKSAISRLMWANLLCRYSQRSLSSW